MGPMGQEAGIFVDLQDTPMFKQTVDEGQASAKKLKDRCAGLLAGAKKYRDALAAMSEAQQSFAAALHDFGCGGDEESLLIGSAVMSQFVKAFRELSYAYSFVQDCVDKDVIEVLQHTWLDEHMTALREDSKKYERRCAEHEAARLKHLSLKKVTRREVLEKSHADLAAARQANDEARYELARHLNTVEVTKRHAFLTMVVGVVYQHLAFFRQGATLLGRIEGPYSDAMAIVEVLRKEGAAKQRALDDMIRASREAAAAREAIIARGAATAAGSNDATDGSNNTAAASSSSAGGIALPAVIGASTGGFDSPMAAAAAAAAAAGPFGSSSPLGAGVLQNAPAPSPGISGALNTSTGGFGSGHAGGSGVGVSLSGLAGSPVVTAAPGGPVQLTAAAAGLVGDIERLIRTTQSSGGQQVTIIKQGYLAKKSQGKGRHDWKRRFFVLDSTGMMYYYSHKGDNLMQLGGRGARPKNTLPLLTSTVKLDAEDLGMRCCFRVVSPEGIYTLQAESDFERAEWIAALQGVIGVLLNGSLDLASLPRVPLRPTHSRHNSWAAVQDSLGGFDAATAAAGFGHAVSQPSSPLSVVHSPMHQDGNPAVGRGASGSGSSSGGGGGATAASVPAQLAQGGGGIVSGSAAGGDRPPRHPRGSNASAGSGSSTVQQDAHLHANQQQQLQYAQQPSVQHLHYHQHVQHHHRQGAWLGGDSAVAAGGSSSSSGVLDRLRHIDGNRCCADCGAPDPDWASLNLGILLCIECSGIHRQLGVHISKVRSCTLDVKVWEEPVLQVFEAIGNTTSNSVWEAAMLQQQQQQRQQQQQQRGQLQQQGDTPLAAAGQPKVQSPQGGNSNEPPQQQASSDDWVWCDSTTADKNDISNSNNNANAAAAAETAAIAQTTSNGSSSTTTHKGSSKPAPSAPLGEKSRYIQDKYVGRHYVLPVMHREAAQAKLWDAVESQDVSLALLALAAGADINAAYRTPRAQRLVRQTTVRDFRDPEAAARANSSISDADPAAAAAAAAAEEQAAQSQACSPPITPTWSACGMVTVLHSAAAAGCGPLVEFLLQNGADWRNADANGRTPLHYAILHESSEAAKSLLKRGGELGRLRDARGRTGMDLVMARGRVSDEELFLLLSSAM